MAGMIHSNLPVFDGKGFDDWCVKMDAIIGFPEVDEIVKKGFKEPLKGDSEEVKRQHKENKRLDCKARMLLHQCVSAAIFQKVSKAVTAKEVWDILQERYGNSGKVKKYDHIVVAIEECKDLETMKEEELQNSLEAHEQHLIERKNAEKDAVQRMNQALQARNNQSFKGRGPGRGKGRTRDGRTSGKSMNPSDQTSEDNGGEQKEGNNRGGRQFRGRERRGHDKRNVQCYTCNKYGHYSAECWHNEAAKKTKNDEMVNLAQEDCDSESDLVVLMSTLERLRGVVQRNSARQV
ncbi:uncharacterized protein LOC124827459 [Vigna umbellata]|uniref:uncharacterized protein LOC124827459 n=1 Tax=Vigna umbellata TaxID=87088 RepID=UPI001F5EC189|nr:uncharacterized protein LOC124827459 [Vigna umbellata]